MTVKPWLRQGSTFRPITDRGRFTWCRTPAGTVAVYELAIWTTPRGRAATHAYWWWPS